MSHLTWDIAIVNKLALSALRWLGHQGWIPFGLRNRVLFWLCNPNARRSREFEVNFFGFKYRGNLNSYLDWVVYFYGAYQKQELFLLRDIVFKKGGRDCIVIDIGANIGHHSLYLSQYAREVYAFEPYGAVRERLEEKICLNNINNIRVVPLGLGLENKELDFFAPVGCNAGTGSFVRAHAPDNNQFAQKLKVVKGDDYFEPCQLSRIDLIKIDVEEFEKNVLLGLKQTLHRYQPVIFCEYSAETRASFANADELKTCIPDGYKIIKFNNSSNSYRLSQFEFDEPGVNLLLIPPGISSDWFSND